ncbi:cysteine and histidine-rich domain-containing protein morgana [Euwallacea fornicatus]|uniref:cysteine and histidine-rich domain-containing protein morgana n=1 Tax=Euwallacea fornicatus TaxID=995702 RepID=UPI00338DBCC0
MANEQCFNRGCGQKYDPTSNGDDSCRHHPGAPFFHDAYKGWSCCNKKCTDFTEFLNIRGCTVGKHSNIKPPEPEKSKCAELPNTTTVEIKPIVPPTLKRPPLETPMVTMEPDIALDLLSQIDSIEKPQEPISQNSDVIIGTNCKNGACNSSYEGPDSNISICLHHPGVPIFHEGLKYWSCCQKKTTDFNSFLNQKGCKEGKHLWKKDDESEAKVNCRWDYHQTGSFVIVSVYAKQYSPSKSVIKLSPIRMYINLVFPQENSANFELDVELRGVIDIAASQLKMYKTKVEIKMKKLEAGSWSKLEAKIIENTKHKPRKEPEVVLPPVEAVDLNDI